MNDMTTTHVNDMPSAIVRDDAEISAWNALSRDEQLSRYQALLASPACGAVVNDSMDDVLAVARQRVSARRNV